MLARNPRIIKTTKFNQSIITWNFTRLWFCQPGRVVDSWQISIVRVINLGVHHSIPVLHTAVGWSSLKCEKKG